MPHNIVSCCRFGFLTCFVYFGQEKEGDGGDTKQESKSYQQLVDFLLTDQVLYLNVPSLQSY